MTRVLLALVVLPSLAGCLWQSPEDAERDALGPETGPEEGPLHRPGQPCLVCHGEGYNPGEAVFDVAGTVYMRADDPVGLGGALVTIVDDSGHSLTVTTNRAGNFMVGRGGGEDEDEGEDERGDEGEGAVRPSFDLDFPLRVSVTYREHEQVMRSAIHREGSCAACHGVEPGATSVGKIYLVEETTP